MYVGFWVDGTDRRVHRSDDAGATWTDVSGDAPEVSLPNISVTGIVVDTTSSETIYVATPIGMFITRDGGATWAPFDEDLPNAYVSGIDLRVANNVLYASTFGPRPSGSASCSGGCSGGWARDQGGTRAVGSMPPRLTGAVRRP